MGKVTQEARDAAAKLAEDVLSGWCHIGGNDIPAIRNGLWDDDHADLGLLVKAFARFEAETIARTNNHAELVEALREIAELTIKQQLPITSQVHEIARKALYLYGGEKP